MGSRVAQWWEHQCVPGLIPGPGVICELSLLLVLFLAPRGFSPGTPVFPSPQKPTFPIPIWSGLLSSTLSLGLWLGWSRKHSLCLTLNLHLHFFYMRCVLLHSWREIKFTRFYPKWLLWQPATAFWGGVIVLTPTLPALLQNKIWLSTKHMMQVSVLFCAINLSLTINSCFQCFLQDVLGNNLILYYTHWTNYPLSRDSLVKEPAIDFLWNVVCCRYRTGRE